MSEPPIEKERRDGDDKKKKKATIMKVVHKARPGGSSNSDDDDLEADPFNNSDIIRNLTDKFALPREEVKALKIQGDLQAEINCLQEKVAEAEHLTEEKAMKNESLRRALWKEELISIGIKAALALEEEKKEVEIKVVELKVRMSKSILEVAFINNFKLCEGRVVQKFLELDLSFLEEEPDEETGSSSATTNPSFIEVVFEPAIEVPEPMQGLEIVSEVLVEPVPKPVATPGVPSSFSASLLEVGGF
ncbi:hypothetical protein COCNU_scaffold009588G000010 [Cocos nucifera]|nr:hypothetical protein [Cocos nucifera]